MMDVSRPQTGKGLRCWTRAFGGVGNAANVQLHVGSETFSAGAGPPSLGESGFTTVTLLLMDHDEVLPSAHAGLGELVHTTSIQPSQASAARDISVSVNRGAFSTRATLPPANITAVSARTYCLSPAWSDHPEFHTTVNIVFLLFTSESTGTEVSAGATVGAATSGPCDHLGLVLLDVEAVETALDATGLRNATDLVSVLGGHDVGDELVRSGALIPIWGMRPWLYRVVIPGSHTGIMPLGRRVCDARYFEVKKRQARFTITPGKALRNWQAFDATAWPCFTLPQARDTAIEVLMYSTVGFEPIAPEAEVGILPTISVVPLSERPPRNGDVVLFDGVDPFNIDTFVNENLDDRCML